MAAGIAESVLRQATVWTAGGSIFGRGKRFFSPPQLPDWLWGPPTSYPKGTGGSFHRGVKLTTLLHLVPRSGIVALYLHSLHASSWRDA
jgi:hypothetical protein